jgi:hypothetical protein
VHIANLDSMIRWSFMNKYESVDRSIY